MSESLYVVLFEGTIPPLFIFQSSSRFDKARRYCSRSKHVEGREHGECSAHSDEEVHYILVLYVVIAVACNVVGLLQFRRGSDYVGDELTEVQVACLLNCPIVRTRIDMNAAPNVWWDKSLHVTP